MKIAKKKLYKLIYVFFVVVLLKRMSYNKKTKRQMENERSQNKNKKAIMAHSAPDPKILPKKSHVQFKSVLVITINFESY